MVGLPVTCFSVSHTEYTHLAIKFDEFQSGVDSCNSKVVYTSVCGSVLCGTC